MTNISKAIIVDDAPQIRKLLRLMLTELASDIHIIGEAENTEQAKELIQNYQPDLVFLDIEMPGKNGLQLVDEISDEGIKAHFIFITAFNQYAVQAFRLSALDYLLKPLKEKELLEALDKFRQRKDEKRSSQQFKTLSQNLKTLKNNTISIPINYGYEYISVNDILYIEADGSYSNLFLKNNLKKTISKNLKYFDETLESFDFFTRVSRSCIINLNYLSVFNKADRGILVMTDNKEISLARTYRNAFLEKISS